MANRKLSIGCVLIVGGALTNCGGTVDPGPNRGNEQGGGAGGSGFVGVPPNGGYTGDVGTIAGGSPGLGFGGFVSGGLGGYGPGAGESGYAPGAGSGGYVPGAGAGGYVGTAPGTGEGGYVGTGGAPGTDGGYGNEGGAVGIGGEPAVGGDGFGGQQG